MPRRLAPLAGVVLAIAACQEGRAPLTPTPTAPGQASAAARIPDQYIVRFRDDVADPGGLADRLAARGGGRVLHVYRTAVRGFALRIPEQAVAALARAPGVAYVEPDQEVHAVTTQTGATWGLDRIDQRALPLSGSYSYEGNGAGVTAYIIDTGINFGHQEFGGRARAGYDAVTVGGSAADCNGHGTHVAGTVGGAKYGVAKGVSLVAVRVLGCGGSGAISGVIAGVDWVTAHRAARSVANMSLVSGASSTLDAAVANSIAAGVTYAVAAGNGDALGQPLDACTRSPARVRAALTVGATDKTDTRASWSNYGTCVDLFAPGVGITSAWYTGSTATNSISGTSMAAPHVTGAAALYLAANPGATPGDVAAAITSGATTGVVRGTLSGAPNRLLYAAFSSSSGGATSPPPVAALKKSCSRLTCTFNASGSTGASSYSWAFGDGTGGTGQVVSHSFAARRNYTVVLTARAADGRTDTASTTVKCNKRNCS